ncbi:hypothetical protein GCM10011506_42890 [Marivirga lumbricoides]|uniref:UspA domain-containing protein n=1 Tax=Marivirga lumbricoides TaxID=1046115 RepID=A0ABQ1N3C2_9BACT|nr:hypothetical protein GCM10011506_42890 [Marivirga lumbricoides]
MDKVLCPVDFSEYSLNALEYAANLLQIRKGNLTLLHIFTEEEFSKSVRSDHPENNFSSLKEHALEKLRLLSEDTEDTFNINCTYNLSIGGVDKTIANYAESNDFDYIVMGTLGSGYNQQTIIGSQTMRTVAEAKTPVITVPIQSSFIKLESVIYASDYSDLDKLTMQKLVSFIYNFHSRIRFVHVTHTKDKTTEKNYETFKDDLETFLGYDKISYHLMEYKEDISHGIQEFVNEHHGDLLVLLKRKRNFLDKLLSSSVSKELSYFSTRPLLIYKE